VLSLPEAQARQRLAGWRLRIEQAVSLPEYVGKVVNQFPVPGQPLAPGEVVTLVVAIPNAPSEQQLSVPSLRGLALSEAIAEAQAAGFRAEARTLPSDPAAAGRVMEQRPLSGSLAPAGSSVLLLVGRGAAAAGAALPGPASPPPPGPRAGDPPIDPVASAVPGREPGPPTLPTSPPGSARIGTPTLISPSEGQSFPRAYGSTFQWTPVRGAEWYEWELEAQDANGEWRQVAVQRVPTTRHRPHRMERGRFRGRVRAMRPDGEGDGSAHFRLYMY
jgi:hypothetical protein